MIDGFLVINKEAGMTSARVLNRLKGILRAHGVEFDKIGHTGTLDPDGEGVLPVALGRATRLFDYITEKTKVYYTEFVFGAETDTLDGSGTVIKQSGIVPSESDILRIIPDMLGETDQIPPIYSAKSINGKRAYDLARDGKEVCLQPKRVRIDKIDYLGRRDEAFAFRITCGSGTYIRSIARDMAHALNTYGYMRYICREQSGKFTLDKAYKLSDIDTSDCIADKIIPMDDVLSDFPKLKICGETARLVLNGVPLRVSGAPDGYFTVYANGELAGIGTKDADGGVIVKSRLLR